jgi:hypothetical protein
MNSRQHHQKHLLPWPAKTAPSRGYYRQKKKLPKNTKTGQQQPQKHHKTPKKHPILIKCVRYYLDGKANNLSFTKMTTLSQSSKSYIIYMLRWQHYHNLLNLTLYICFEIVSMFNITWTNSSLKTIKLNSLTSSYMLGLNDKITLE